MTLCRSKTYHMLCLHMEAIALREKERGGNQIQDEDSLAAQQTEGAPLQTVYYNGKAAKFWKCCITCIFPLACPVFCMPEVTPLPDGLPMSCIRLASGLITLIEF